MQKNKRTTLKTIEALLKETRFLDVATCDFSGRPNIAPKFFLKIEGNKLYLVDYTLAKTYQNLQKNPRVSLSLMDLDSLTGYQINGVATLVKRGKEFCDCVAQLEEKEVRYSVQRVIEAVRRERRHEHFEVALPKRVVIIRVGVRDIAEITPHGGVERNPVR